MTSLLRFFHIVAPPPVWMRLLTIAMAMYAIAVVWIDPPGADSALAALLLWQMLCASTGFAGPASAGHFDPILIREWRTRIALAHLIYSTRSVIAAWALVAAVEWWMGVPRPLALEPGRLAAFAFVGASAWALSLGSARLVSGALWLGALVVLAVTPLGLDAYASMSQHAGGPVQFVCALLLAMVCPFLMIDVAIPMRVAVAAGLVAGAAAMASAGVAYIVRRSYALEPST